MSLHDIIMQRMALEQGPPSNLESAIVGIANMASDVIVQKQQEKKAQQQRQAELQQRENKIISTRNRLKNKIESGELQEKTVIGPEGGETITFTPINRRQQLDDQRKLELSEERLKIQQQELVQSAERNMRLLAQKRLQTNVPVDIDIEKQEGSDKFIVEELGVNMDDAVEMGLAERKEGSKFSLLPERERTRLLSGEVRTFPQTVATAIDEFKDSRDILVDTLDEYKDLKLDLNDTEKNIVQQLFAESGPLSVSAKSNLLRQFREPRVAALYDKLERAFQKYRVKTTGAQASDKELQRLRPLIANLVQNPEVFQKNMSDLLTEIDQSVSNRIATQRALGRDENTVSRIESNYFGQAQDNQQSDINQTNITREQALDELKRRGRL